MQDHLVSMSSPAVTNTPNTISRSSSDASFYTAPETAEHDVQSTPAAGTPFGLETSLPTGLEPPSSPAISEASYYTAPEYPEPSAIGTVTQTAWKGESLRMGRKTPAYEAQRERLVEEVWESARERLKQAQANVAALSGWVFQASEGGRVGFDLALPIPPPRANDSAGAGLMEPKTVRRQAVEFLEERTTRRKLNTREDTILRDVGEATEADAECKRRRRLAKP